MVSQYPETSHWRWPVDGFSYLATAFTHFRLVVDYLHVQRFHTPGVFLAKFEASLFNVSEKDPCFGVVEDNQNADLVVEHIGYGQCNGVTKTMLMNWKTMRRNKYFLMYYGNLA